MTDVAVIDQQPAAPAIRKNGRPARVTGKLVLALKAIAWEGLELDEAAQRAGMTTRAVRKAIEKRHVLNRLKEEREVFRAYVSAQNIHHAKALRDKSGNAMAKLGAMKYIDAIEDEATAQGVRRSLPGVTIIIGAPPAVTPHERVIEAKPLIDNEARRDDD